MHKIIFFFIIFFFLFTTYSWISASSNIVNIVTIGDSITYGTGDEEKKGYVGRLEEMLEKQVGYDFRIENFGVPKYTATDVLSQLKEGNLKKAVRRADYLILFIGTNDFRKSVNYTFSPLNTDQLKVGKNRYSEHLQQIVTHIRRENKRVPIYMLGLYHPYVEYENSDEIKSVIEEWNEEIEEIVNINENTYYIPTIDLLSGKGNKQYFHDHLHPNGKGYKRISRAVYEKITKPLMDEMERPR